MFYKKRMEDIERQIAYLTKKLERLDLWYAEKERHSTGPRSQYRTNDRIFDLERRMESLIQKVPGVLEIEESVDGTTLTEISRVSHDVDLRTAVIAILEHLDCEVVENKTNRTRCEERH